jgi:hypothetical protein
LGYIMGYTLRGWNFIFLCVPFRGWVCGSTPTRSDFMQ